jgi:hypothetical protein
VFDLHIANFAIQEQIEFKLFDQRPIFKQAEAIGSHLSDMSKSIICDVSLQLNNIKTWDEPFSPYSETELDPFYKVKRV